MKVLLPSRQLITSFDSLGHVASLDTDHPMSVIRHPTVWLSHHTGWPGHPTFGSAFPRCG